MPDNRRVRMRIDSRILCQLLMLPEGTEVVDVHSSRDRMDQFVLTLTNPHFAPVRNGDVIPEATAVFNRQGFVEWGDGK